MGDYSPGRTAGCLVYRGSTASTCSVNSFILFRTFFKQGILLEGKKVQNINALKIIAVKAPF